MTIEATRRDTILSTLRSGPATAQTLATLLNAPQASIRATIARLRKRGTVIDYAADNNGAYRLVTQ